MYDFREHGYTVVPQVISKELCDFVTQYTFFEEIQNGKQTDPIVPNAFSKYIDPVMETMLLRIQGAVEDATALTICPTYSYYRIYGQGDVLDRHIDRHSCQISASLCFNHSYGDEYEWAIYMGDNPVILKPGDMVVYRGMDVEHGRDAFDTNDGHAWHVQGFFHYVDVNSTSDFTEWKYDKRIGIGYKHDSILPEKPRPIVIKKKY